MGLEHLTYTDLRNLSLEALSINKNEKLIKAIFRHKNKPNVSIAVEYNKAFRTSSISYPSGVSASNVVVQVLEACMKRIAKDLEK